MLSDVNLQALRAFSTVQAVAANNVANVNTEGFRFSSVALESGQGGQGVRVAAIQENTTHGAPVAETAAQTAAPEPEGDPTIIQPSFANPSDTDLVREMTTMMLNEHAFEANTQAVRASSDMTGVLLDMVV